MDGTHELSQRVDRGGVYYNIEGENPVAVLRDIVQTVALPKTVDRESLLQAILEREALSSTALGDGIAVPHPRNPVLSPEEERIAVCFPRRPIPYAALDRRPVFVLFLILSADTRSHLFALSELSFLCRRAEFRDFLSQKPSRQEVTARIAREETSWKRD